MAGPPAAWRILTRPSLLLLHLAAVLAVVATVLLGRWQLDVWQSNRHDTSLALVHAPAKPLSAVIGRDAPFPGLSVGQPVRFNGQWMPSSTVFVSGRTAHGQYGYWMVTPLSTCGSAQPATCRHHSAVPVVVGWTPRPTGAPPPPHGTATVTGWLQPGDQDQSVPNPRSDVLPALQIGDLAQRIHEDLYSAYVILSAPATARAHLVAVTPASLPKAPTFTSLRNFLYALEWWVFGGFAVFLWWRWCRDAVAQERAPHDETPADAVIPVSTEGDDEELPSGAGLPSQS